MKLISTKFNGLKVVQSKNFTDSRGFFKENFKQFHFKKIKFERTPKEFLNKTILSAQEVEDLVEYLYSLK